MKRSRESLARAAAGGNAGGHPPLPPVTFERWRGPEGLGLESAQLSTEPG